MPTDLSVNVPAATPLSRSLSKLTPRDPTTKAPPPRPQVKNRAEDDILVQPSTQVDDQCVCQADDTGSLPIPDHSKEKNRKRSIYQDLPIEVLEVIVDHVVCQLGSTKSGTSGSPARNWNAIMRHPRRKNVGDLALVSNVWRQLIQERIFRHSNITLPVHHYLVAHICLQSKHRERKPLLPNVEISS